jgi:PAS domain S-box-containing protein
MPYGNGPNLRFYNLVVSPLFNRQREPIGRLVILSDITQHKRDQAQLEQIRDNLEKQISEQTAVLEQRNLQLQNELNQRMLAEKRFEDVVESAPDAMIVVDQDSAIRLVNAQAERLFGFSREELLCQNIGELVVMRHREEHFHFLQQYLSNPPLRPVSYETDVAGLRKDGSEFPVEISLGPLKTTEGMWVSINVRDISKRKLAEAEQNRLLEENRQTSEQLRALAARLQEVQEIERHHISNELHDRVGQNLTGLNLNLQVIQNQLSQEANPAIRSRLIDSLKLVEQTTRQVRDVMADLRPPGLDEYGLFAALRWYSGEFSDRTGTEIVVVGDEITPRLPPITETVLFRLAQEALNNAAKHAQATRVVIRIVSSAEAACLSVEDNGIGFDPQDRDRQDKEAHWGLITMQQRAASIGAQLSIDSSPGRGTTIFICVPR